MIEQLAFGAVALIGLYIAIRIIAIVGDIITSILTLIGLGFGLLVVADFFGLVNII